MMPGRGLFRDISPDVFLQEYWQKKPCLFRAAWSGEPPGPDLDELAGLAMEPEIESRLVRENTALRSDHPERWTLQVGPFTEATLTGLPESHWTLLVQALDQWLPEVHDWLSEMAFLPAWRLDDIMISGSSPGGTVGPHYDHYDVFLFQAEGQRRWQVGAPVTPATPVIEDAALNLLRTFEPLPGHDWILEPGDVLYVPPLYAHYGIAETTGLTWSFGFRSPDAADILQGIGSRLLIEPDADFLRYRDPDLTPEEAASNALSPQALERARQVVRSVLADDRVLADWLGSAMTANKYDLFGETPSESPGDGLPSPDVSVRKALPTRCTAWEDRFYTNGRVWTLTPEDSALVDCLLNEWGPWYWEDLSRLARSETAVRALQWMWNSGSLEAVEDDGLSE